MRGGRSFKAARGVCMGGRDLESDFSEAGGQNIFSHPDQESLNCPLELSLPDPHWQERQGCQ